MPIQPNISAFVLGYIECALWCTDPKPGQGTWRQHGPFTIEKLPHETRHALIKSARTFEAVHRDLLNRANALGVSDEKLGHDFWLTRNHEGSGFWDEAELMDEIGKALSEAAYAYGECALYVVNNRVHLC